MEIICIKTIRIYFYIKLYTVSLNKWIAQIWIWKTNTFNTIFEDKYYALTILFHSLSVHSPSSFIIQHHKA